MYKSDIIEKYSIDLSKLPATNSRIEAVENLENLIIKLNTRKELSKKKIELTLDIYDKNELEISYINTDIELAKIHTSVIQSKKSIEEYIEKTYLVYKSECDDNWESLMKKALKESKSLKHKVLKDVLKDIKIDGNYDSLEIKIGHYVSIKKYLYGDK